MSQGVMYVEVLPSTRNIGKAVEKDASAGFKGAEKTGQGFFSRVGTWAKRGAIAVTGMVAAVGALAVGGGISRALNIEDAQAKLKGLGHDTKNIESIMNDALASVKGTAFGLDTAATVASTAVAAGIKPGQELEKYLRLTADAATIAGASMEEMGSILNKATTAGKVYTQELNQLADRGLPVFQWLQDEYQVTAEELRKMVSAGKVDAETFRKVIEENIGGAALASGDTTRGAFKNMMAALSRLGLVFVGDGLAGAKVFFGEITTILDGLGERFGPMVDFIQEKLGGMFEIEGMGDRFLAFLDNINFGDIANKFVAGRGNLIAAGIQILNDVITGLVGNIPALINSANHAVRQVIDAIADNAPAIINAALRLFLGLATGLVEVLPQLLTSVTHMLTELITMLLGMLPQLISAGLVLFLGLVDSLAIVVPQLIGALVAAIPQIIESVVSAIPQIVSALANALPQMLEGAQQMFIGITLGLAKALPQIIEAVVGIVPVLIESLIALIPALIDGAVLLFMGIIQALPLIIPALITGVLDGITSVINALVDSIPLLVDGAVQLFTSLIMALPIILPDLIMALIGLMPMITTTILSMVPELLGAAIELFMALVSAVPSMIPKLGEALADVWPEIWASIKDIPGKMLDLGKDIIQGLIDGAKSMIDGAIQAVKDVGGAMLDGIKGFLGIKSPSRVFRDQVGKMVGLGLLDGLDDPSIRGRIDGSVSHMVKVPEVAGLGGRGGITVEQHNNFEHLDPMIAVEMSERRLAAELRGA